MTVAVTPSRITISWLKVELAGLARIKAQRNESVGRRFLRCLRPTGRISAHGIMAAVIAAVAQFLVDPDQRQASRFGRRAFSVSNSSRSDRQGSIFGRGCVVRSYVNSVAPDRMTLRTVFRDNRSSRQICLIDLPLMKCARLTFAIVSTMVNLLLWPSEPRSGFVSAFDVSCTAEPKEKASSNSAALSEGL